MEMLSQIGIFAAKGFIILLIIGLVALLVLLVAQKAQALKSQLHLENLNDQYKLFENSLKMMVLGDKELKQEFKKLKASEKELDLNRSKRPRLYVIDFEGDIRAEAGNHLRHEVSAVLTLARPEDEVLIRVESPGGVVHGYGFCASQLARIRDSKIPLTVAVDKVAASGGYMMAAVANKIICAPFAIVGSVGVLAQVPNLHRLLKKMNIDYQEYTAGEFKRTVSLLGEITPQGETKFKEQLEQTHLLFKEHIKAFRPNLDLQRVANGEYWYGHQALALGLIDEVKTSDDYLMAARQRAEIIKVSYKTKKSISERFSHILGEAADKSILKILTRLNELKLG